MTSSTRNADALSFNLAGALAALGRGAGGYGCSDDVRSRARTAMTQARRITYPGLRGEVLEWSSDDAGGSAAAAPLQPPQLPQPPQPPRRRVCRVTTVDAGRWARRHAPPADPWPARLPLLPC